MEFSVADIVIIAIVVLSALVSFVRGFVREVLSLGAWVVALIVAYYFAAHVAEPLAPYITDANIRLWAAGLMLFIATLIIMGLVNLLIGKILLKTGISGTDRLLGVILGALRGGLLVAVILLAIRISPMQADEMWPNSKMLPYFDDAASWLWDGISGTVERWQGPEEPAVTEPTAPPAGETEAERAQRLLNGGT